MHAALLTSPYQRTIVSRNCRALHFAEFPRRLQLVLLQPRGQLSNASQYICPKSAHALIAKMGVSIPYVKQLCLEMQGISYS